MCYEKLVRALNNNICNVEFIKKNGESRAMKATRHLGTIPIDFHPKGISYASENEEVVKVFDLGINEWRSFRVDSLVKIDVI
jgi:hypothetical protein